MKLERAHNYRDDERLPRRILRVAAVDRPQAVRPDAELRRYPGEDSASRQRVDADDGRTIIELISCWFFSGTITVKLTAEPG